MSYFCKLYFYSRVEKEVQMTQKVRKNDNKSIVNISETEYNESGWETNKVKEYRELDLTNDFMFFKVMLDPMLCKKLLEVILDVEIERIEYPEGQKTIKEKYDSKSICLDVYVKDGKGTVYNVEMQTTNPGNLPKRSRYYQDLIDLNLIVKGEDYAKLNKSFVIFICMEDVFKQGRPIYTFENRCVQNTDLTLEDGTTKIFLNPNFKITDGISSELANFLKFLTDGRAVDEFTERLAKAVEAARNNPKLELEYKSFYAKQQDMYNEGKEDGIELGIKAFVMDHIEDGISKERLLQKLQKRFGLSDEEADYYYDKFSSKQN